VTGPRNYIVADTLKDGTVVTIRAIRCDDRGRILEAFTNLERESIFTRFFSFKRHLTESELQQMIDVDFDHVVETSRCSPSFVAVACRCNSAATAA